MGRTRFDLAELDAAESAARETVQLIEQRLAELRATLTPVRARWTGHAADAWDEHQRRWDTAAADLAAGLTVLHQVVARARANYAAALDANIRTWRT